MLNITFRADYAVGTDGLRMCKMSYMQGWVLFNYRKINPVTAESMFRIIWRDRDALFSQDLL